MITKPKGTYDIFYQEAKKWQWLENKLQAFFANWQVQYIRTPLFENSELFKRNNDFSEVVQKQTYDFIDKSGRNLTLRPEGTAGVIRAIIENKLYVNSSLNKFYYFGPNYRYERPQKGRFREFYQFGVEVIGDKNIISDIELLDMVYQLCVKLGLDVTININYLGGASTISTYSQALAKHFTPLKDKLCPDCQERLTQNPLRIIDCKVDANNEVLIKNLPPLANYYDEDTKNYFSHLVNQLQNLHIPFKINPLIVRGLDYYTDIVFEVISNQSGQTLAGGGRYDGLIKELGGPNLGAIGFAFGCERVLSEVNTTTNELLDYFVVSNTNESDYAYNIVSLLRSNNYNTNYDFSNRNFGKKLRDALDKNPTYLIFIGEEEVKNNTITIKNVSTQKQETINKEIFIKKIGSERNV